MHWLEYLFGFQGRINRAKYWLFVLIVSVAIAVPVIVAAAIAGVSGLAGPSAPGARPFLVVAVLLVFPFAAALFVSSLAIYVKRLHDRNRSGWWIVPFIIVPSLMRIFAQAMSGSPSGTSSDWGLLTLLSLPLSIWAFVEIGCLRGTVGSNRFGPDPLGGPDGEVAKVFE